MGIQRTLEAIFIKALCLDHHVQLCSNCWHFDCGDNTNPAKPISFAAYDRILKELYSKEYLWKLAARKA